MTQKKAHIQTQSNFYTNKGYKMKQPREITESMEDYLEMIYRHVLQTGHSKIGVLAQQLHVKPSSASKMVNNLKCSGLVDFEKYGLITLTKEGWELGKYLLYRHEVLHRLFCLINASSDELQQVEQIEHFLDFQTVKNIEKLVQYLEKNYKARQ